MVVHFGAEPIEVGDTIEIIAYCSLMEVLVNMNSVGTYREVYHLNGENRAYIHGLVFRRSSADLASSEDFTGKNVYVKGIVSTYNGVKQISIVDIATVDKMINPADLVNMRGDTELLANLNDLVYNSGYTHVIGMDLFASAKGMLSQGVFELPARMYKFLAICRDHYPESFKEYMENLPLLVDYIRNTECKTDDKINLLLANKTPFLIELLFREGEYPEFKEVADLHFLILTLRG